MSKLTIRDYFDSPLFKIHQSDIDYFCNLYEWDNEKIVAYIPRTSGSTSRIRCSEFVWTPKE